MQVPPRSDVGVLLAVARAAGARRRLRPFVPVGFQLQCVILILLYSSAVRCVDCSGSVVFVNAVEAGHTARQMKLWYGVTNLHPQLTC